MPGADRPVAPYTRKGRMDTNLTTYLSTFLTPERLARIEQVLDQRTRAVTVVVENLRHSHNASAVLRSCECFGIQNVHIVPEAHGFQVVGGIAQGAAKWLSLFKYVEPGADNTAVCLGALKAAGYRIAAATLRPGAVPVARLDLGQPVALCFGTEESGLSVTAHAMADAFVQVPMCGFTESFNISVAAALCLYQITQALRQGPVDWRLTAVEREILRLTWIIRSLRHAPALVERFFAERGMPVPERWRFTETVPEFLSDARLREAAESS